MNLPRIQTEGLAFSCGAIPDAHGALAARGGVDKLNGHNAVAVDEEFGMARLNFCEEFSLARILKSDLSFFNQ